MVTPNPIESTLEPIATAPRQRVYTRRRWADSWEEAPALWCNSLDFAVSPSIDEATFEYRYGEGIEPGGEPTFAQLDPKDLLHHYVKVELPQTAYGADATADGDDAGEPLLWYGVIEEIVRDHHGSAPGGQGESDRVPSGWQRFQAFGLAFLLDRQQITTAWVFDLDEVLEKEIHRAVAFNAGLGQARDAGELRGNRSLVEGDEEAHLFAGALANPEDTEEDIETRPSELWNGEQILKHLLVYHQPRDDEGEKIFNIELDPEGLHENLKFDQPIIETEGRTLKGVIDQLIDRRRLHVWRLIVDEENEKVLLQVRPAISEGIELEDGREIEPNPEQHELDFERAFDIQSAVTVKSLAHGYDQVIIRGAKRGCCFTIASADNTLEAAWSSTLEEEYETAATGEAGYDGLDDPVKIFRNETFRAAPKYEPVFAHFRVPRDWDFKAGNGGTSDEGDQKAVCPDLNDGPESLLADAPSIEMWRPGLRFLPRLPFVKAVDYDEDHIADRITGDPPRPPDPDPTAEYLPISAYIRLHTDDDEDAVDRYSRVDKISKKEPLTTEVTAKTWAASCRPLEHELGVELRVGGGEQYMLAQADFTQAEDSDWTEKALDWHDVRVTVMMEADQYVEARFPAETPEPEAGDLPRVLVIDVGDRCRLDYVAPGTWVGLRDGVPLQTNAGGFVRDDRHILRNLARLAGAWYLATRQAFSLEYRQVRRLVEPGDMIVTISEAGEPVEVAALVTRTRYNLDAQTTTVETDFSELDVLSFVPRS